jgi:branched-chain amino acid transport system ATP-binding protein
MSTSNILTLNGVSKSFGRVQALADISFTLERKKITILIGPNGSGKTTLVNVISGQHRPDTGEVVFESERIDGRPPHEIYRKGLARTFQIPSLFPKLTVLENVLIAAKGNPGESLARAPFKGLWVKSEKENVQRALEILELTKLTSHKNVLSSSLSGGQTKLLEMARALMSGAKLLMLDEPVSGVNPTLAHEILRAMLKMRDDFSVTFLFIEHRLDIALRYVDLVMAMANGRIIASGDPNSVISDPRVIEAYLGGESFAQSK